MDQGKKVIAGIVAATLMLLLGGVWLISNKQKPPDKTALAPQSSYKKGATNGSAVLVEFGDFQCPACQKVQPIIKQLLKDYPNDLTLVFRHFPLGQHRNSRLAATAAEAAGLQGKFWEMHDKLYETQGEWSENPEPEKMFASYATGLGLKVDQFTQDMKSEEVKKRIENDLADGANLLVSGTPTFFLNGTLVNSVSSLDDLRLLIKKITGKDPAPAEILQASPPATVSATITPTL